MEDTNGLPEQALEDIAYLARSMNRVRILDVLASGRYERGDVEEITGIARTSIDRIVKEFEERGWTQRTSDGYYVATPTGERILAEFLPFLRSMEAIRTLGDLVAWLPTDEVPIGLHHFADATVSRPDPAYAMSTVEDLEDLLHDTSMFHFLIGVALPSAFERTIRDVVVNEELRPEIILTNDVLSYQLEHPERLPRWREYIEAGGDVYRYDGQVPCNIFRFDDIVVITNSQSDIGDHPLLGIGSENEEVLSWAQEVFYKYRENADLLVVQALEESTSHSKNNSS